MPGVFDPKAVEADEIAHRLLSAHVRGDSISVERITAQLEASDDAELVLLVLERAVGVSTTILLMLAGRVGANASRAVEDAFLPTRLR
ncbi:MAG: hypothetical protein HZA58_01640 [Acidimicrobiia bacterium]|nr:hypothetical protein [Acidimicrobiia bacterium]